jgi:subtilisin-like proprotein convertase family protein
MNFLAKVFSPGKKVSGKTISGISVFALLAVVFSTATTTTAQDTAPQTVFTNATSITINDASTATPYPSTITVSGLGTSIPVTAGSVKVTINGFTHTFSDDVAIALVGPTGAALLLQDGAGDDPDMTGVTYTLSDTGAAVLPNLTAWTAGTYKPTTYYTGDSFPAPGPLTAYGSPGPTGGGTATFSSVFGGTNPNGVWSLYVEDLVSGDSGVISGGWSLEITTAAAPTADAPVDFNGDGKTDFAVVRNTGGGTSGQITWFYNTNGTGAPTAAYQWGLNGDAFLPADYDGDGKDDIAVWRPGAATVAAFYILQSQTSTVRIEPFGQTGDDPSVIGDYNGDGKDDVAVYRAGASAGQQSTWFYRTTPGGAVTYTNWGQNGDFPAPGDYDGDGKSDFVVQRNNGGGQARFWELFATGTINNNTVFGTPTDVIVPGDYDGDGKTDFATIRGVSGALQWQYLSSQNGSINFITFGISATDFPTQGDYDGDGKTDVAVWRPSATPGASAFYARSTASAAVQIVPYGATGDLPAASYNRH